MRPTAPGAIGRIDADRTVYPVRTTDEFTFNGFKSGNAGSPINFVFHPADFTTTAAAIDRTARDGRYPSRPRSRHRRAAVQVPATAAALRSRPADRHPRKESVR
jgi:hypothetical protein